MNNDCTTNKLKTKINKTKIKAKKHNQYETKQTYTPSQCAYTLLSLF